MLRQPGEQATQVDMSPGKTPEEGQKDETPGNTLPVVKAEKVEQANIAKVAKVTHKALADEMLG